MPATPSIPTVGALGMGRRGIEQGIVTFTAAAAPPAPFAPTDLTGCELWLDGSDTATITAAATLVSQWDDKSGNARHFTQGTGSNQPKSGTRTQNALNVIDFDGGDRMNKTFAVGVTQPFTLAFVVKYDGASGRAITPQFGATFWKDGWTFFAGSNLTGGTTDTAVNLFVILANGTSSKMRVNGVEIASGDSGGNGAGAGAGFYIGGDGDGNFFDGYLGELAMWSGDKTANFTTIESGFNTKWAVY